MTTELKMPALGEGATEGTVSRWLKKPGEPINKYEPLLEVSTDKVDTEISSPADGILLNIQISEGTTVKVGTLLAIIGQAGETLEGGKPRVAQTDVQASQQGAKNLDSPPAGGSNGNKAPQPITQSAEHPQGTGRISPVVARIAAENQVRVEDVQGTGHEGRVTKQDILKFIESQRAGAKQDAQKTSEEAPQKDAELAPWEQPGDGDLFHPTASTRSSQPTQLGTQPQAITASESQRETATQPAGGSAGDETVIELTPMRRAIAEHMVRSTSTAPHVTTVMEVDMSKALAHWQAHKTGLAAEGIRLTYTPYFVMATVAGLKAVPQANSTWRDNKIVLKHRIHIGMAVALQDGLIVPVIQNADEKNLRGLARAVNDLAERARAKRLQAQEVQGGTFSITNHGISGSLMATPIINQPQAGILGVGAITQRAVVIHDAIAIRPMCYLSFTFDHRILDGAEADRFLATVKDALENWSGS